MRLLAVVLSLLAAPLFAAMSIDPVAPTSATPITLTVTTYLDCGAPKLTETDTAITVTFPPQVCLAPVSLHTLKLPLGQLPPGDYEVTVVSKDVVYDEMMFFVRDANATLSIIGSDIGPTAGGTTVMISAPVACAAGTCAAPLVTFNGVAARVVRTDPTGTLTVVTPPGAKGIAKVVVSGSITTQSGQVFRYYDADAPPAESMFERVLIPVYYNGSGALGSHWLTEIAALNADSAPVEVYGAAPLQPHVATTLSFGDGRTAGVLMFIARDASDSVRFGGRVRDTSRSSDDWGTEVPVVRESALRGGDFSLLNIPIDPRFRVAVRIYGADSDNTTVTDSATGLFGFSAIKDVALTSGAPCPPFSPCVSDQPAYVNFDPVALFPELAGQPDLIHIDVAPHGVRSWAFATITNNVTQHVTVVTPQ